jgi:uncharacterized protein DUF397
VTLTWHKSTYSNPSGNCVEIAEGDPVKVRDSKHPGPELTFDRSGFAAFVAAVVAGDFDDLIA